MQWQIQQSGWWEKARHFCCWWRAESSLVQISWFVALNSLGAFGGIPFGVDVVWVWADNDFWWRARWCVTCYPIEAFSFRYVGPIYGIVGSKRILSSKVGCRPHIYPLIEITSVVFIWASLWVLRRNSILQGGMYYPILTRRVKYGHDLRGLI